MTKNILVPEGYKKTELGVIPEDWEVISLKEITDFHKQGYYTKEKYVENGVKFLRITDIDNRGNIKNETMPSLNISKTDYENYKLESGDFAFARSGAIGRVGLVRNNEETIFGSYIIKFKFNQEVTDNEFFIRYFNGDIFRKELFKMIQGASNQNVNAENIKRCNIILPTLKEQQKIASILSKVDEQIEQTEQIIEKTEILKKGLMQKLLTKGIGHTKFKKTELGEIPEEWSIEKLGVLCELITKGTTPTTVGFSYQNTGINFVKIESISASGNFLLNMFSHISENANKALKRSILKDRDLLFSIAGALGRVAIVNSEILPANTNQALAIIRLKEDQKKDIKYVYFYLKGPQIQKHIDRINVQSAQANLSLENINNFKIALPQKEEQQKITSILSKVDSQIRDNQNYLTRLQELKKGLMQDLLTGKVRVCV
ncbi:restriction endonuclease subunit S [Methanosarcina sp. 1.H.A.2.2]|uniref:restriction endonuclease subunit S n=1 Tax=Methanosarcina sp. 1.H.A.2.2 TaxID=1483601 RepID=UPI00062253A3|nr:restriction endonuclease subunit S [Methanosarcina sp. 1.H.A.2.2]KKH50584.1 hypothetical protein EO93_07950 [Methanosarcina sp. 1.H.A.2.2]